MTTAIPAQARKAVCQSGGFTLIEIAMVLIVIGYLLQQLIVPYGAQLEQTRRNATRQQLTGVLDAVTGYAVANGRLPCPAGDDTHGFERTRCDSSDAMGYVPAVNLGLAGPVDEQGRLLDSWGYPLLYAVSQSDHPARGEYGKPDFVTAGEMSAVGLPFLASDLVVCQEASAGACARAQVRANQVPVVVLSLGQDRSNLGHQAGNQDSNVIFVTRPLSKNTTDPFDDLVLWMSESKLIHALVKSGVL